MKGMVIDMNQGKITVAGLKKYLSLFEKSGVYWFCTLLIPITEVFVSSTNALFYQKIINAVMASDMALFKAALWMFHYLYIYVSYPPDYGEAPSAGHDASLPSSDVIF